MHVYSISKGDGSGHLVNSLVLKLYRGAFTHTRDHIFFLFMKFSGSPGNPLDPPQLPVVLIECMYAELRKIVFL